MRTKKPEERPREIILCIFILLVYNTLILLLYTALIEKNFLGYFMKKRLLFICHMVLFVCLAVDVHSAARSARSEKFEDLPERDQVVFPPRRGTPFPNNLHELYGITPAQIQAAVPPAPYLCQPNEMGAHLLHAGAIGFLVSDGKNKTTIFHEAVRAARILQHDVETAEVRPTLLFLGRSGTHIEATLRYLYEKEGKPAPTILTMAFSGAPGLIDMRQQPRPGPYRLDLEKDKPKDPPFQNVIVPKREKILRDYWDSLGMHEIKGPLWAIDYINSGANLYSWLELADSYFQHHRKPFPSFRFYGINLTDSTGSVCAGHLWMYTHQHNILQFDSYLEPWGIRPIRLQAYPLGVNFEAYTVMNFEDFHTLYAAVPKYQAWHWKRSTDDTGRPIPGAVDPRRPAPFQQDFKQQAVIPAVDWILAHPRTLKKGMSQEDQRQLWIEILKNGGMPDAEIEETISTTFSKLSLANFQDWKYKKKHPRAH